MDAASRDGRVHIRYRDDDRLEVRVTDESVAVVDERDGETPAEDSIRRLDAVGIPLILVFFAVALFLEGSLLVSLGSATYGAFLGVLLSDKLD